VIPATWTMTTLGNVVEKPQYGHTAKASHDLTGPRFLRITDIQASGVDWTTVPGCEISDAEVVRYQLAAGDIVFARTGATTGKSYLIRICPERAVFASYLIRIRSHLGIEPRYLHNYFDSHWYWQQIVERQAGIAQPGVNANKLLTLELPIAPLNEQRRIVAEIEKQFTRLDAALANLERVKANLKRARASVLKAAVEGRLVLTEAALARAGRRSFEPASVLLKRILVERERKHREANGKKKYTPPVVPSTDDLPEGWTWTTVDQLTELITSGSRGWSEYYAETGARFIRSQDINTYRLNLGCVAHVQLPQKTEGSRTRVYVGDVLVIITGANVTIAACVQTDVGEAYVNQHVALCRPLKGVLSPYLHLWMMAEGGGRPQLESAAYGAGKPGLNLTNIRDVRVGLPPLAEQHRIVAEVERRLSVIDTLEQVADRNLTRCKRLRQSILKRAFEGKLVPQDPNDEPAEKLLARIQSKTA
jgi:type I restriction enzyme S subunit